MSDELPAGMPRPRRRRTLRESFGDALRGILHTSRSQRNARIHLLATLLVLVAGFGLRVSTQEWAILVLTVCLVITVEMLNTALEALSDAACPGHNPQVRVAKDVAAGAVLVSAVAAVAVGLLVLGPRLAELVHR